MTKQITLLILLYILFPKSALPSTNTNNEVSKISLQTVINLYQKFEKADTRQKQILIKEIELSSNLLLEENSSFFHKIQIYVLLIKSYETLNYQTQRDLIIKDILSIKELPTKVSNWLALKQLKWSLQENKDINSFYPNIISIIPQTPKNHLKVIFNDYLFVIKEMFNRGFFDHAVVLSNKLLDKTCSYKWATKNILYKNSILLQVINNRVDNAIETYKKNQKCNIAFYFQKKAVSQIFKNISKVKNITLVKKFLNKIYYHNHHYPYYIWALNTINMKNNILRYYAKWNHHDLDFPVEDLEIIAKLKNNELKKQIDQFNNDKLVYVSSQDFKNKLASKFKKLDDLSEMSYTTINIGSGSEMIHSFSLLAELYKNIIHQFDNITFPKESSSYSQELISHLQQMIAPIKNQYKNITLQAIKLINTKEIFSEYNNYFLKSPLPIKINGTSSPKFLVDRI